MRAEINSHQSVPSPSLWYSLKHTHRSIGYRNRNPQSLTEWSTRLMYLCVYDSRDSSHQSGPSPSLSYSLKHGHRSIGYRHRNPPDSDWIVHETNVSPCICQSRYFSPVWTLPVPILLSHTYTQHPPHAHDHIHSGTSVYVRRSRSPCFRV